MWLAAPAKEVGEAQIADREQDAPMLEIGRNTAGGLASSDVVCGCLDHNQLPYFQGFAKETLDAIYSQIRLDKYRISGMCIS